MQIVSKLSLFFSFIPILLCQGTIQQKYKDQILLSATPDSFWITPLPSFLGKRI